MNTKRMSKWVIVLFLLAALPLVTAVMAQGDEPAAKEMSPAVTEVGESPTTLPWTNNEVEPNNTRATAKRAIELNEYNGFVGGVIGSPGDVDYWKIQFQGIVVGRAMRGRHPILLNIDARSFGSPVDTIICLYSDDGFELACNDDMQGSTNRDSLLYYNLEPNRDYFLKVEDYGGNGGSDYRYQLLVSQPLLISAAAAGLGTGTVATIPFQSGDVLAWSRFWVGTTAFEKWVMLLDLSDLGVKGNVTNLAGGWRNSDYLLVGFAANATLPGITGPVNPWEVVVYDPSQVGPNTVGTFQRWWNGKQQGLTTTAEKPDAIDWPNWNGAARLFVSTGGAAAVPSASGVLKLADEDVGLWSVSDGRWTPFLDGGGKHLGDEGWFDFGLGTKDVIGYSYAASYWGSSLFTERQHYIVLQGSGSFTATTNEGPKQPVNYTQKDIVVLWTTDCCGYVEVLNGDGAYRWWHGPDHGWNYNIDAIDAPGVDE